MNMLCTYTFVIYMLFIIIFKSANHTEQPATRVTVPILIWPLNHHVSPFKAIPFGRTSIKHKISITRRLAAVAHRVKNFASAHSSSSKHARVDARCCFVFFVQHFF